MSEWYLHHPRGYGRGRIPQGLDENEQIDVVTIAEQPPLRGMAGRFAWGDVGEYSIAMWRRHNDVADT